jgi:hypothetical protein
MIINLTPHAVVIAGLCSIPPTAPAARVSSDFIPEPPIDGIEFGITKFGAVENLPDPVPGVWYIVSAPVIDACSYRRDLVRPDTGPDSVIRDEAGKIIAVRRLTR